MNKKIVLYLGTLFTLIILVITFTKLSYDYLGEAKSQEQSWNNTDYKVKEDNLTKSIERKSSEATELTDKIEANEVAELETTYTTILTEATDSTDANDLIDASESTGATKETEVTNSTETAYEITEINDTIQATDNGDDLPTTNIAEESLIDELPQVEYQDSNANNIIPERVVLTVGKNPSTEVNISFEADNEAKAFMVKVAKKEADMQFPTNYKEYEASLTEVETTLGGQKYLYNAFSVHINGLEPDTEYLYTIGLNSNWTYPKAFKTLSMQDKITVGFFGDIQGYKQAQYDSFRNTLEKAKTASGGFDLILLAGDIVDSSQLHEEWRFLDNAVGDYLSSELVAATPGNHDVKGGDRVYSTTFVSPDNGAHGAYNSYYFEIANSIIAVIDTEKPSTFSEQKAWLKEIMQTHENDLKIVLMHRSVYPISYNELNIREFSTVFEECNIDLVLSGHDHIYSRTTMHNNNQVETNNGSTYVVGGSASGSKYYKEKAIDGGRYWEHIIYDEDFPVFSLITIENNQLQFIAYAIKDNQIVEIDSFNLKGTQQKE